MHLTQLASQAISASSAAPCLLDGESAAYLIEDGMADLFAVRRAADGRMSRRHSVARLPAGGVVTSFADDGAWRLLLVPLPGTRLRGIPQDRLRLLDQLAQQSAERDDGAQEPAALGFAAAVDRTLLAIADALRPGQAPRGTSIIQPGQLLSLAAGEALAADGAITWLRPLGAELRRNDDELTDVAVGDELLLLAGRDWIVARTAGAVETHTTVGLLGTGQFWAALGGHTARLLHVIDARIRQAEAADMTRIDDRKRVNAAMVGSAARQSLRVLGLGAAAKVGLAPAPPLEVDPITRAAAVLRVVVGNDPDLVHEPVDRSQSLRDEREALLAVARSSALHTRELALTRGWWRRDFGPLVLWQPIDEEASLDPTAERPVRALPVVFWRGRYHQVDPETLARSPITPAVAARCSEQALTVQLPMPVQGGLRGLLRAGLHGARQDARGVLLAGSLVAALGLAAPMVTGTVLGEIASTGRSSRLFEVSTLFVMSALVAALVGVINNLLFLRLEGRAERDTQILVWDRLMRLPVRFFSGASSGELTSVVLGVTFIREALGGLLSQALSAVLATVMVIALLFVVDVAVAALAVGVVVATMVATGLLGVVVVRRQRRALPVEHRLSALTNQLIGGITKVKLAAAEERAYARWATLNTSAEGAARRVKSVQALLLAVCTALPMVGNMLLLAMLAGPLAGRIRADEFFLVNTGFLVLVGMMLVLVNASLEALALLPRVENLSVVADTEPENRTERIDPGELSGEIELVDVSFAYSDDGPPVLDRLSLHFQPGQFVAVVGPSGCGKSTLLRLLLGFEHPQSGSVLYDRQDLSELDVAAVRRQCGVVLQNGQLFAGTIRENIAGAGNFRLEQVWNAARMAGIDSDIADLPMGMSTMIPFGGGTLSVGQRQRLLIARALVGGPRVLFFDEATSALDNRTQEIVTNSTNALAATRVVIAHRLTTVVGADVIVVLNHGRVVQTGRYDELLSDADGLFAELARRQLLDDTDE